jgi:hypothetical protein
MTLMVRTPDGADLGSIELAEGKLVPTGGAAAGLAKTALLETGSAQAAYAWLNGYDNGYVLVGEPAADVVISAHGEDVGISSQAALAGTITGQLDLSAIHGHHIPGTDYTYRHGFKLLLPGSLPDPVLLKSFNDKYPQWMVDRDKEAKKAAADASADADHAAKFVMASVRKTTKERYEEAPMVPSAGSRKLTPGQRMVVKVHRVYTSPEEKEQYAPRAKARGIAAQALPGYSEVPSGLLSQRPPDAPPRLAAAGRARADAAALVGDVDPRADPALGSLAGIGAGEDAIKKYIDARIATEVARQVGEISAKQADDMKERLAQMHLAQQKSIAAIRSSYSSINDKGDHDLRAHTVANALFTFGGVAVAGVGIATGVAPILAALVAGLVPLANVIHDYARNLG